MTGIMKRYLFGMPVVAMVIMVSMFCSCGNKGNTSQVQTTTDSVAVESIEAGDAPIDVKMVEKRLQEILSKLITEEGDVYLPECFTEGFKTYYTRACEKADKEGFERPRIWWQYSDDDPTQFSIISVTVISNDEASSNLTLKGELYSGTYEVLIKKQNGNWLIDMVTEKEDYSSEMEGNSGSLDTKDSGGYDSRLSEKKLTETDLKGKSKKELEIMRNSIYARYGYKFKRKDLLDYFSQYSWYNPTTSDMATLYKSMTDIERYNIELIKKQE